MKALYTILFFSDMAALVVLTYLFLKSLAHGCVGMQAVVWVPGIFFCIVSRPYLHPIPAPPSIAVNSSAVN